jgi:hypothetical protein
MRYTFGRYTFGTFTRDTTDITPDVERGISDLVSIVRFAITNLGLINNPITNLVLAQKGVTDFDITRMQLNADLDIEHKEITKTNIESELGG